MTAKIKEGYLYDNGDRIVIVEYINRERGEADIKIVAERQTRKLMNIGRCETIDVETLEKYTRFNS